MVLLEFNDLEFVDEHEFIKVYFLKIYYFKLSKSDLKAIADFRIHRNAIYFDCSEKKGNTKFNYLLNKGFNEMICSLNKTKTVYVHKNSGIPLIGAGIFGIIDRNTSCIEVKPITNCNLDCVYCSVNAGLSSVKQADFIVEKDYLVEELNKIIEHKEHDVEIHIGPQGEPFLYTPLVELVKDIKKNPKVKIVSIDTNGILITKEVIDELAKAGMTRINISLNALEEQKCSELAGMNYNLNHVLNMINYAKGKIDLLIAPVLIPGMNDNNIKKIIDSFKGMKSSFPPIGIQNFLNYKRGRNPVKQRTWEEFYNILIEHEKKYDAHLKLNFREDFGIVRDSKLKKPFKKHQIIKARIICPGHLKGEKIGVYEGRAIIIEKCSDINIGSNVNVLIIRDKHNIYRGVRQ